MKYVIILWVFIFSLLSLAPNMQGSQYFKITKVIEHFQKDYKGKEFNFASFTDFLKEHYGSDSDLNNEEHKKLPFKSISTASVQLSVHELKISPVLVDRKHYFKQKVFFSEPTFLDSKQLFSIWNPPQTL